MSIRYELDYKPSVEKDLRRLPAEAVDRLLKRSEALQADPFPRDAEKLSATQNMFRIPVGSYRIVYGVDTRENQVTIHYIRHRRDVYRSLRR